MIEEESGLKITKENSANGGIPETFQGKILPLDIFSKQKRSVKS